jgi:hypothetical protein
MKINATQAVIGLALLFVMYRIGSRAGLRASTTQGPGSPGNAINEAAEWYTYAGSWGST